MKRHISHTLTVWDICSKNTISNNNFDCGAVEVTKGGKYAAFLKAAYFSQYKVDFEQIV